MNIFTAHNRALANMFNFNGRATRSEFWLFILASNIISLVLLFAVTSLTEHRTLFTIGFISAGFYCLGLVVAGWAVLVRRLHDINRTGLWILLLLLPFGIFVLLVMAVVPSYDFDNEYGEGMFDEIHETDNNSDLAAN